MILADGPIKGPATEEITITNPRLGLREDLPGGGALTPVRSAC